MEKKSILRKTENKDNRIVCDNSNERKVSFTLNTEQQDKDVPISAFQDIGKENRPAYTDGSEITGLEDSETAKLKSSPSEKERRSHRHKSDKENSHSDDTDSTESSNTGKPQKKGTPIRLRQRQLESEVQSSPMKVFKLKKAGKLTTLKSFSNSPRIVISTSKSKSITLNPRNDNEHRENTKVDKMTNTLETENGTLEGGESRGEQNHTQPRKTPTGNRKPTGFPAKKRYNGFVNVFMRTRHIQTPMNWQRNQFYRGCLTPRLYSGAGGPATLFYRDVSQGHNSSYGADFENSGNSELNKRIRPSLYQSAAGGRRAITSGRIIQTEMGKSCELLNPNEYTKESALRSQKRKEDLFQNALEAMRIYELRRARLIGESENEQVVDMPDMGTPLRRGKAFMASTPISSENRCLGQAAKIRGPKHITRSPIRYTPEERAKVIRDRMAKEIRIIQCIQSQRRSNSKRASRKICSSGKYDDIVKINALPVYVDGETAAGHHKEHLALQKEHKKLTPLMNYKELQSFGPKKLTDLRPAPKRETLAMRLERIKQSSPPRSKANKLKEHDNPLQSILNSFRRGAKLMGMTETQTSVNRDKKNHPDNINQYKNHENIKELDNLNNKVKDNFCSKQNEVEEDLGIYQFKSSSSNSKLDSSWKTLCGHNRSFSF